MARLFTTQVAAGLGLAAGLLLMAGASPAAAQQQPGGRMRVLVPDFEAANAKVGEKIADRLKKTINDLATHAPAEEKEVKAAIKKFGLNEKDVRCQQYVQMATGGHVGADLVLCGTIDASNNVSAVFWTSKGTNFEVPSFVMQSEDQAAQHVVEAFRTYTRQLELVVYCNDYIQSQAWQQALDNCNQAVELNPKSEDAHYMRGSALNELGRSEEALAAFKKVLELNPLNDHAILIAGIISSKLGQKDAAQKYFKEYLELNPGDAEVRLKVASDVATAGDPEGALILIEESAKAADASLTVLQYAGHFAMNAALKKQQETPQGPDAPANADAQRLFRTATEHYEKLLARPDKPEAEVMRQVLQRLILAYTNLGDNTKAIAAGERGTREAPQDAGIWFAYANALREAKRYDEAMVALGRASQADPNYANVERSRALILMDQGKPQEAVAAIKAAAAKGELEQGQVESLAQQMAGVTGNRLVNQGKHDEAVVFFRAARELGKAERTIGMANLLEGFSLVKQVEGLLGKDVANPTVAQANRAKPLLARAKTLLEGAGGYQEGAATRATLLQQVGQFMEIADAIAKTRR